MLWFNSNWSTMKLYNNPNSNFGEQPLLAKCVHAIQSPSCNCDPDGLNFWTWLYLSCRTQHSTSRRWFEFFNMVVSLLPHATLYLPHHAKSCFWATPSPYLPCHAKFSFQASPTLYALRQCQIFFLGLSPGDFVHLNIIKHHGGKLKLLLA